MADKFTVKDENIIFYEIEMEEGFNIEAISADERAEIEAKNEKSIAELKDYLIQMTVRHICTCHQPLIVQREMMKPQIVPASGPRQMRYAQEDFDNYNYGVVMMSKHGVHGGMPLLVTIQCQMCQSIQFLGDLRPLMRLLANGIKTHLSAMEFPIGDLPGVQISEPKEEKKPEKPEKPKFIMKDLVTGEETPADDLAEALFGKGTNMAGSLSLENAGGDAKK